jgi:hypothetical protein
LETIRSSGELNSDLQRFNKGITPVCCLFYFDENREVQLKTWRQEVETDEKEALAETRSFCCLLSKTRRRGERAEVVEDADEGDRDEERRSQAWLSGRRRGMQL